MASGTQAAPALCTAPMVAARSRASDRCSASSAAVSRASSDGPSTRSTTKQGEPRWRPSRSAPAGRRHRNRRVVGGEPLQQGPLGGSVGRGDGVVGGWVRPEHETTAAEVALGLEAVHPEAVATGHGRQVGDLHGRPEVVAFGRGTPPDARSTSKSSIDVIPSDPHTSDESLHHGTISSRLNRRQHDRRDIAPTSNLSHSVNR